MRWSALAAGIVSGWVVPGCARPRASGPSAPIAWRRCPPLALLPDDPPGDCATVEVPLRWEAPDGPRIAVSVRRFRATGARRGAVWMLDGGPGGTGEAFATPAWRTVSVDLGFDLMLPSHRGTGRSTALACPDQEAPGSPLGAWVGPEELPGCVAALVDQWGDDLSAFGAHQAARDVAYLIGATAAPGDRTVVFGGSYGSYWAQRLMEVQPARVDGWLLEGLVPSDAEFLTLSRNVDEALREALGQCDATPACAAHLPGGFVAAADAIVAADRAGTGCTAALGWSIEDRQRLFAAPVLADRSLRVLLPPLIARWTRCDAADRAALRSARATFPDLLPPTTPAPTLAGTLVDPALRNLRSSALVLQADLIRDDRPAAPIEAEVAAEEAGLLGSAGNSLQFARDRAAWPRLDVPAPADPPVAAPIVAFGGLLDGQTPRSWSERFAADHPGPNHALILAPTAGHMTWNDTRAADGTNCTVAVYRAFVEDPTAPPDRACFDRVPPLDWAGTTDATRATAAERLGVADPWGDAGVQ